MFYDKLSYRIYFIINEKYIAQLEKADAIDTIGARISYLIKWVNDRRLDLQKQKKIKKQFLLVGILLTNGKRNLKGLKKRKFYKKKIYNKQRGEKYKRKYYNKPNPKKTKFFRKAGYCPIGKNNRKCWAYGSRSFCK